MDLYLILQPEDYYYSNLRDEDDLFPAWLTAYDSYDEAHLNANEEDKIINIIAENPTYVCSGLYQIGKHHKIK